MVPLGEEPPWEPPWKAKIEFREGFFISCAVGFGVWFGAAFVTFMSGYSSILRNALRYGSAALVQLVWSVLAQASRPHFARGIRASLLVTLACFLGALAVCG